jgi:hypothetical protein
LLVPRKKEMERIPGAQQVAATTSPPVARKRGAQAPVVPRRIVAGPQSVDTLPAALGLLWLAEQMVVALRMVPVAIPTGLAAATPQEERAGPVGRVERPPQAARVEETI